MSGRKWKMNKKEEDGKRWREGGGRRKKWKQFRSSRCVMWLYLQNFFQHRLVFAVEDYFILSRP